MTTYGCPENIKLFVVYDKDNEEYRVCFLSSGSDSQLEYMRTKTPVKLNADMKTVPEKLGKYTIASNGDVVEIEMPEE